MPKDYTSQNVSSGIFNIDPSMGAVTAYKDEDSPGSPGTQLTEAEKAKMAYNDTDYYELTGAGKKLLFKISLNYPQNLFKELSFTTYGSAYDSILGGSHKLYGQIWDWETSSWTTIATQTISGQTSINLINKDSAGLVNEIIKRETQDIWFQFYNAGGQASDYLRVNYILFTLYNSTTSIISGHLVPLPSGTNYIGKTTEIKGPLKLSNKFYYQHYPYYPWQAFPTEGTYYCLQEPLPQNATDSNDALEASTTATAETIIFNGVNTPEEHPSGYLGLFETLPD
ncbi:MAG: hypothetical protein AAB649_07405, partial [Patescibacteria group bacterium]